MKLELNIQDEKVKDLNDHGKIELTKHCQQWAEDIVDEASRIEASRNNGTNSEITAAIINQAVTYSTILPIVKKKKNWIKIIHILNSVLFLITGGLFNTDKFKESTSYVIWFIILFTISIGLAFYLTFNSDKDE